MAFLREAAGFGSQSGVLGNVVMVQTEGGTIMRARPASRRRRGVGRTPQAERLAIVKRAWDALDEEAVSAWRTYALERAAESPRGSRARITPAYSHFSGLASKVLQLRGGTQVPSLPPRGVFLGDGLWVTVEGGEGELRFTSDGAGREGVVCELLTQRLSGPHNATRPKSYVNAAFVAFEGPETVTVPVGYGRHWACAVRFVEASSGRMTPIVEVGRATTFAAPGTATP